MKCFLYHTDEDKPVVVKANGYVDADIKIRKAGIKVSSLYGYEISPAILNFVTFDLYID